MSGGRHPRIGIPWSGGGGGGTTEYKGVSDIYESGVTGVTSASVTLSSVAVGDLVLALVQRDNQSQVTGITAAGAAMTVLKTANSGFGGFAFEVWALIAASASASASIQATWSASASWATLQAVNYSSGVSSLTLLGSSCNGTDCAGMLASSTDRIAQQITTAADSLLVFAGADYNDIRTHTPATGWTKRRDGTTSSSIQFLFDRTGAAGTYGGVTAISTTSVADQYMSVLLAFPT